MRSTVSYLCGRSQQLQALIAAGLYNWQHHPEPIAVQDDVLMYGGRGGEETRPQFVLTDWHVASEFMKDFNGFVSTFNRLCLPALLWGCGDAEHLLLGL